MLHQSGSERGTGHDQHVLARHQSFEPIYRLLRGGSVATERKELFGAVGCAEGPEAGACPPGQNHCPPHECEAEPGRSK